MVDFISGRLKKRAGYWRVDGVGEVLPRGRLGTRVAFLFSEIQEDHLANPYTKIASANNRFPMNCHSSWLRLFTPGSIWFEGKKISSPETDARTFSIATRTCAYMLPDEVPKEFAPFETLLPTTHVDDNDNRTILLNTQFALARTSETGENGLRWLIIPTAELFRFYLGTSSRLISAALSASLNDLVDWSQSTFSDGKLTIYDRTGNLTKREALFLGRTLVSEQASEAVFGAHKYLARTLMTYPEASKRPPLFIKSIFPFSGTTELQVSGKKIPLTNIETGKREWAILVSQIRNCSHPFGIDSLKIVKVGATEKGKGGAGDGNGNPRPPKQDLEDQAIINDDPADPELGRVVVRNQVCSFQQLNQIPVEVELISTEEFECNPRKSKTPVKGYTFDDGANPSSGSGNQGVDQTDVTVKGISRDITIFLNALKFLRIKMTDKWEVKTIGLLRNNQTIDGEIVTRFPTMGSRYSWYLIPSENDINNIDRPRKVVCAEIRIGDRYVHLIEMELRENESGKSLLAITSKQKPGGAAKLGVNDIVGLLKLTAVHNGWPNENLKWRLKFRQIAEDFFEKFSLSPVIHPYTIVVPSEGASGETKETRPKTTKLPELDPQKWAEHIHKNIKDLV